MITRCRGQRRRAATAVETALVLIPLTMCIFGIFEFGRLLMIWNVLNNAAREGCRYALVNNTDSTITGDVATIVQTYMAGQDASLTNYQVTIAGTQQGNAITDVTKLVPGDMIIVTVSGQYQFMNIIPFVTLPTSVSLSSSVVMICEGGT